MTLANGTIFVPVASSNVNDFFIMRIRSVDGSIVWVTSGGGTGEDSCNSLAIDAGFVYITGQFSGSMSIGNTALASFGGSDVFIAKYTNTGIPVWAKQAGGASNDVGKSLNIDKFGNAIVAGNIGSGSCQFDSFTVTAQGTDIFIAQYTANGQLVWVKNYGGDSNYDSVSAVDVDTEGTIYFTGQFGKTIVLDSLSFTSVSNQNDLIIAVMTNAGVVKSATVVGSAATLAGYAIALDKLDNVISTGAAVMPMVFPPLTLSFTSPSTGSYVLKQTRVCKVCPIGTFSANSGSNSCASCAINMYNDVLGASRCKFCPRGFSAPAGSTSLSNCVPCQLGKYLNLKQLDAIAYGSAGADIGYSVATDINSNRYVVGSFSNTIQFGNISLVSQGGTDLFLLKMNEQGSIQFAIRAGGTSTDVATAIAVDTIGNCYITGYFAGTTSFGTLSVVSSGANDIFTAKYNTSGSWEWLRRAGGMYILH